MRRFLWLMMGVPLFGYAAVSPATPTLNDGLPGNAPLVAVGGGHVKLVDTDGVSDEAAATLLLEDAAAGKAKVNAFGICRCDGRNIAPGVGETARISGGTDSPISQQPSAFDLLAGTASTGTAFAGTGPVFGFRVDSAVAGVGRVYTDELLDAGGTEPGLILDAHGLDVYAPGALLLSGLDAGIVG